MASLYAGLDCSTQSLTAIVIDAVRRELVFRDSLPFASPCERTGDPGEVLASPLMWARTLDAMLGRICDAIDRRQVRAISGSAQQHGSVYCSDHPSILTREMAPIWMDTSTARECDEIESALGGPLAVARLTGSRCYPRFTGPQIRKFARVDPEGYTRTRRIHLVSSYLASLLVGQHAPLDHADASGMNLMDLQTRSWDTRALEATASDLHRRLPPLVPSATVLGRLAGHWQSRFALPAARIVAWSGDNPCSLIGTGLIREGQLAISLGTSDTIFGPMDAPRISTDGTGHVFASPLGTFMGITVFSNGSLARERVRRDVGMTWEDFSAALRRTVPGNDGAVMLPWFDPEITPRIDTPNVVRVGFLASERDRYVRAVIEGQALAMRRHAAWMGVTPDVIHATGGASANVEILQVFADVFNAPVRRFPSTDSAALGAAIRAYQADTNVSWHDAIDGFVTPLASPILPIPANVTTYRELQPVHADRERAALARL